MADKLAKRKTNPDNTHRKSSLGKGLVDTQFERFEEAWFNFHRYDADGSGTIDRGELALLLADLRLHVGRKGRTAEQMEEWAKRELKKSDTNGDGVLSFEEFLSYYNAFVARFRSQMEELYEIDDSAILGKGAFGVVVSGVRIDSGKGVAVKRLIKANLSDTLDLLHNEIAVWEALDHPNLVLLLDVFEDAEHLTLVTELMHGGDLFKRLRNAPNGRFDEIVASRFVAQIAAAVAYLHHHGVVHCDLKPANLLVVEKLKECELYDLTVKVADFGLSQTVEKAVNLGRQRTQELSATAAGAADTNTADDDEVAAEDSVGLDAEASLTAMMAGLGERGDSIRSKRRGTLHLVCGTPNYFAPELVRLAQRAYDADEYDASVDNWAVGCVVWELLVGSPPFDASSEEVLYYKIETNDLEFPEHVSEKAKDLILGMTNSEPEKRLSCDDALRHPWLKAEVERMGLLETVK